MQQFSNKVASRSELLELVETLGMYAQIEQPSFKQDRSVKSVRAYGPYGQRFPLHSKNTSEFHTIR
ncbi:hypothetical protein KBC89_04950 [Candidatus Woesebacteria bacterium]|nr:hypothetical protein [Candidatus Woesebacteria bacterium]